MYKLQFATACHSPQSADHLAALMRDLHDRLRDKELREGAVRDAYGFEVKAELHSLYNKFSPLWKEEEEERSQLWSQFLEEQREDPDESDAQVLQRFLAHYDAGDGSSSSAQASPEFAARLQQLRALVQAGVPMASRGRFWQLFLRTDAKREAGLYEQLVARALPPEPSPRQQQQPAAADGAEEQQHTKPQLFGGSLDGVSSLGLPVVQITADTRGDGNGSSGADAYGAEAAGPAVEEGQPQLQQEHSTFTITPENIQPEGAKPGDKEPVAAAGGGEHPGPTAETKAAAADLQGEDSTGLATPAQPAAPEPSNDGSGSGSPGSSWLGQIEKDLHRTFPGHPLMDATGRGVLRRILAAYAIHNPSVGYCQGMNFVAACLMLFMGEEEAFWCLVAVVEDLLPGYFHTRMVAPQVDQRVFGHLMQGGFPSVWAHFQKLEVDVSSCTIHWFLCMFINSLPLESCLRVWDVLFFEGSAVVLFRVALALVDVYQKALLECRECSDVYMLLQAMGPMSFDSSRLLDTACSGYGHVRDAALRVLRAKYRPPILEQMRDSFSSDEEFAEFAYYSSEEPRGQHSRSRSFVDALAGGAAAGEGEAGERADVGHLTPPRSCGSMASDGGGSAERDGEALVDSARSRGAADGSEGSAGGRRQRPALPRLLLPAAKQAMAALSARLVPSSLPSLLPSGALNAQGAELPPQQAEQMAGLGSARGPPASARGLGSARRGEQGRVPRLPIPRHPGSARSDKSGVPPLPTGRGVAQTERELRRISTSTAASARGPWESPTVSGAALARGAHLEALTPFHDASTALALATHRRPPPNSAPQPLRHYHQQQGAETPLQGVGAGARTSDAASALDALDFRSPIRPRVRLQPASLPPQLHSQRPQQQQQQQQERRQQPMPPEASPRARAAAASKHRRTRSALPSTGRPLGPDSSMAAAIGCLPHCHHRGAFLPDWDRLSTFVPDLRQPAVAAAYRIASKPSPRYPLPFLLHQHQAPALPGQQAPPSQQQQQQQPTATDTYTRTPLSSVLAPSAAATSSRRQHTVDSPALLPSTGGGTAGRAAAGAALKRDSAGPGCDPVRVLRFESEEDGAAAAGAAVVPPPGSAPSVTGQASPFASPASLLLPARRHTDSDIMSPTLSRRWSDNGSGPSEGLPSASAFSPKGAAPRHLRSPSGQLLPRRSSHLQHLAPASPCSSSITLLQERGTQGLEAAAAMADEGEAAAPADGPPAASNSSSSLGSTARSPVVLHLPPVLSPPGSVRSTARGARLSARSSFITSPPATTCKSQLLAVLGQLQEEVAIAESRRHAAEQGAQQAADTRCQLQQQLGKLRRDVQDKGRLLEEVRGQEVAVSVQLGELEGEVCASGMAIEKLQGQVDQRQHQLVEQGELVRLLMDRAGQQQQQH